MDDWLAQFIRNAIEKRLNAARMRGAVVQQPRPQRPGGFPAPASGGAQQAPPPQQMAQPPGTAQEILPRAALPPGGSAIEAADPFAAMTAAAVTVRPAGATLLAAFAGREGLLAGIVLSETLAPPLALRRERDR